MVVEWGFDSPIFMAKGIVQQAHPVMLKKAVLDVITHLEHAHTDGSSPFEIIDRLVQVILTGEYRPPEKPTVSSKVITVGPEGLTPEQEQEIQEFVGKLDRIPTSDGDYDDFLRQMGIPKMEDYRDEDDQGDDDA